MSVDTVLRFKYRRVFDLLPFDRCIMASLNERKCLSTRKRTNIWLIGQITDKLPQTKLPSIGEMMRLFFYYKNEEKKTIRESATYTANCVIKLWEKASIPTKKKKHIINKIEEHFKRWQNLKKNKENKAKRSIVLEQKEKFWQQTLENVFDIAHESALNMMKIEEDKQFLLGQREKGRKGRIGVLDKTFLKKEERLRQKEERLLKLQERERKSVLALTEKCSLSSSTTSRSTSPASELEIAAIPSTVPPPKKRGRKNLVDSHLASTLDVAKLSDRKATIVLTSALKNAGSDASKFNVNRSSIRRQRLKRRQEIADSLKKEFTPETPLTVHWDSKLIEDISDHETVDRLPILVSGQGVEQLLSVPKLDRGTGEACASAVYEAVSSWSLSDQIKCLCFDTTAVNTGMRNGACTLLEQKMEKDMLWLPCRHHVMEIMLEAVVSQSLAPSSGPEIQIFKRFRNHWEKIDQADFKTIDSDVESGKVFENITAEIISFAKDQINQYQPRDDYKELLNLTIIYLGGIPEKGVSFRRPAGLHRARWMAKAIYCLKIYLFRHQLKMSKKDVKAVTEICIFTVRIYVKYWFQAPAGWCAPRNDLQLLKDLSDFQAINSSQAKVALKKVLGHLWYLSEELVSFGFFDNGLSVEDKRKMVEALKNESLDFCPKRITLDVKNIDEKKIQDFVTSNSLRFFQILDIPFQFLNRDVQSWEDDENYKAAESIVRSMKVVNDIAERGVALIEEYNKLLTINEEQKQYLLLLVKEYRKKYPDCKKSTLLLS